MTLPQAPATPTKEEKLIRAYQKAQADIIDMVVAFSERGSIGTAALRSGLLAETNRILADLLGKSVEWVEQNIPIEHRQALAAADQAILEQYIEAGVEPPTFPSFTVIDQEAVEIAVEGVINKFEQMIIDTERRMAALYDQIITDAISKQVITGTAKRQAQAALIQAITNEGVTAIEYMRMGKPVRMSLSAYAEVVLRSATAEVTNEASIKRTQQVAGDLVKMTAHTTSCPICWPLQGRVYSISGRDKRYPRLDVAYSGDHVNIHPNCRHRINPYIPALKTPAELVKDQEFSNRPFEIENMTPEAQAIFNRNLKAYNKSQAINATTLANRKQWQRYRTRMGDEAPARLSTFMRMKNKGGKGWDELQEGYRAAGRQVVKEIEGEAIGFDNLAETAQKRITKEETRMARLDREKFVVFDKKGKELYSSLGTKKAVRVAPSADKHITDNIVTHNHPSGKSFSDSDVILITKKNPAEARVIGEDYIYTMTRPPEGWPSERILKPIITKHYNDVRAGLKVAVRNKWMTTEQANSNITHLVWEAVNEEIDIGYKRSKR